MAVSIPKPAKRASKPRKRIRRRRAPAVYRQRENKGRLRKLADDLMSLYVRHKAGWKCWVCGSERWNEMQMAHLIGKGAHPGGRYKEANVRCLCLRCHKFYTERPEEWRELLDGKIGDGAFKRLFDVVRLDLQGRRLDLYLEVIYWDRMLQGRQDLWMVQERYDALRGEGVKLGVFREEAL